MKNEVQGEIDRVKEQLQHSDNVARELVNTVMRMSDRLSAVEAGTVQDSDAVKHLADTVSDVELSGDSGQQALRDLLSVKIEPGLGEEDAESVTSSPDSIAAIASQPAGLGAGCFRHTPLPPPQPHPHPTTQPSFPAPSPYTPPVTPPGFRSSVVRRKPQEFDGKVSLEAYLAHFELLAQAQGWNQQECAVQLVSSLKGPAMEVLSQLTPIQRTSYPSLVAVLERRYGHQYQAEVFRARFRARVRARGETLQELAQDLEHLVRKAYPGASEELTMVLLRDQFVDALEDAQLKIYVKQAHARDLQEALARALELESFVRTSAGRPSVDAERGLQVRRGRMKNQASEGQFRGACWKCQEIGHKKADCRRSPALPRTHSAEQVGQYTYQPCCRECGQLGHVSRSCPENKQASKTVETGNGSRLGKEGHHQPVPPRPFSR